MPTRLGDKIALVGFGETLLQDGSRDLAASLATATRLTSKRAVQFRRYADGENGRISPARHAVYKSTRGRAAVLGTP